MSLFLAQNKSIPVYKKLVANALEEYEGLINELTTKMQNVDKLTQIINNLDADLRNQINAISEHDNEPSDYVEVNFGGKCVSISREVVGNPNIKYNFFSALFHSRWQNVLPKDKDGKIYLEMDYKWVQSILDAYEMAFHDVEGAEDSVHINSYFVQTEQPSLHFGLVLKLFCIKSSDSSLHFEPSKKMSPHIDAEFVNSQLTEHISEFFSSTSSQAPNWKFNMISTALPSSQQAYNEPTLLMGVSSNGILYGFLCQTQPKSTKVTIRCFVIPAKPSGSNLISSACESSIQLEVDNRSNFIQLDYNGVSIDGDEYGGYGDHYGLNVDKLPEIFQIYANQLQCPMSWLNQQAANRGDFANYFANGRTLVVEAFTIKKTQSPHPLEVFYPQSHSNNQPSIKISSAFTHQTPQYVGKITRFSESIHQSHLSIDDCYNNLQKQIGLKYVEAQWLLKLLICSELEVPDSNFNASANYSEKIVTLYDDISKFASPVQQQQWKDDVISFSVRGETVCLLKSTIEEIIPSSQLAERVSGTWTEQTSTLDSKGRIIIVSFIFILLYSIIFSYYQFISNILCKSLCHLSNIYEPLERLELLQMYFSIRLI